MNWYIDLTQNQHQNTLPNMHRHVLKVCTSDFVSRFQVITVDFYFVLVSCIYFPCWFLIAAFEIHYVVSYVFLSMLPISIIRFISSAWSPTVRYLSLLTIFCQPRHSRIARTMWRTPSGTCNALLWGQRWIRSVTTWWSTSSCWSRRKICKSARCVANTGRARFCIHRASDAPSAWFWNTGCLRWPRRSWPRSMHCCYRSIRSRRITRRRS